MLERSDGESIFNTVNTGHMTQDDGAIINNSWTQAKRRSNQ